MKRQADYIANKGEKIYKQIAGALLLEPKGKFAAIDVESKEYFIGATLLEAILAAKKTHPDRKFHIVRIGHKAAVSFKHRYKP